MVDAGDAVIDQMNTGKHNWDPISAAEHAVRIAGNKPIVDYGTKKPIDQGKYNGQAPSDYRSQFRTYLKQRIKANTGRVKDQNGNYTQHPAGHFAVQSAQEDNLKNMKAPEVSKSQAYKAWKSAGKPKEVLKMVKTNPDQVTAGAKASIEGAANNAMSESARANIYRDPFGAVQYGVKHGKISPAWGTIAGFAQQNPMLFWGGLLVGGIALTSLVSSFLGSRRQ